MFTPSTLCQCVRLDYMYQFKSTEKSSAVQTINEILLSDVLPYSYNSFIDEKHILCFKISGQF